MNKQLILFRHAKSDWDTPFGQDHERGLARRGILAARQMGTLLAQSGQLPERILCSTAVRARTTLELAVKEGGWDCPVEYTEDLYGASAESILELLQALKGEPDSVLLVGHEPTWSDLTSRMIGGGAVHFPTAAMACLDCAVETWKDLEFGLGRLKWIMPPKFFTHGKASDKGG